MRPLLILAALAAPIACSAGPTAAQLPPATWRPQDLEAQQQQEQVRQQLIQQQNQLMALEAQMRAQQGMLDIQAQKQMGQRPAVPAAPGRAPSNLDVGAMAAIPDGVLAESNRRVLDAARNRR